MPPAIAIALISLRMPRFWVMLGFLILLLASLGRLALTQADAARLRSQPVETTATVLAVEERLLRGGAQRSVHLVYRFQTPDGATVTARRRMPPRLDARPRAGDTLRVVHAATDPRLHQLAGEVEARPWFELPVIALALLFAGLSLAYWRNGVGEMRRAAVDGTIHGAIVTATARMPLPDRMWFETRPPEEDRWTYGKSLWRWPGTLRHLHRRHVPVLRDPRSSVVYWVEDLRPLVPKGRLMPRD